jgi:hypothetical protein
MLALALPFSALAQQRLAREQREGIVYEFKYLDGPRAAAVTHLAQETLVVGGSYDPTLRLAYFQPVAASSPDWRDKLVELLKRYDVPPAQVHYQAYLIRASRRTTAPPSLNPIPKELDDAIAEMKKSLVYGRYDLITIVSSVSEGAASASDLMLSADESSPHYYNIEYANASVSPDRKSVSIRPFEFQLRGPSGDKNNIQASISSDVTVHEGQKLVIGKVRLNFDSDIFIILTVKVE